MKKNQYTHTITVFLSIVFFYSTTIPSNDILLSFIIPCYNRARTIPKTVQSIYDQNTNFVFEVICIDDGSTDKTLDLLLSLSKKHPNFRVLSHSENKGASEARNTGIHNARGSLIFTLDSDNLLAKNTLQPLVDLLLKTNADAASVSSIEYINEDDEPIRFASYKHTDHTFDLRHIFLGTPSPASSGNYLFTKESFYRAGGYRGKGFETWEFGLRQLITGTKIAILPNSHYIHRISKDSYWVELEREGLNDSHCIKTLLRYSDILTEQSKYNLIKYVRKAKGFFKDMRKKKLCLKAKPYSELEELFKKHSEQLQISPKQYNKYYNYLDIAAMGHEQYQDIIINNQVVQQATGKRRDCASRYTIIKQILDKYERPFTMIDLGASQGYYSFKTAYNYPAVCVMIDDNNWYYKHTGDQLLSLCQANNLDNIIFLKKSLCIEDIKRLGTCEHFDVILAMNIIHWFENKWKQMTDAILQLGDNIIIETPPEEPQLPPAANEQRKKINDYLVQCGGTPIGRVKRHTSETYSTIYWVHKPKKRLAYSSWLDTRFIKNHQIISSFAEKYLLHSRHQTKLTWAPGINLATFKMYNGAYPDNNTLIRLLDNVVDPEHNDWMPNNIIVQGKKLVMIDKAPPNTPPSGGYYPYSASSKELIKHWISFNEYEQLYDYFWNVLEVNLKGTYHG